MKVTIQEKGASDSYPCLKRFVREDKRYHIVLFSGPRKGTVVSSNHPDIKVGTHSTAWAESAFTPFCGSITLTEE